MTPEEFAALSAPGRFVSPEEGAKHYARHLAENPASLWIDASVQLPPPHMYVLIYEGPLGCRVGYHDGRYWLTTAATHWMFLPPPPR